VDFSSDVKKTTQLNKTFSVLCGTRRCINVVRRTRH